MLEYFRCRGVTGCTLKEFATLRERRDMKVLVSGYHNPHYDTVTEYMEWAVRALGHEVVVYDDRRHLLPGRIRYRVPWLRRLDLGILNRRLVLLARREKPVLALVTGGDRILGRTVDFLKTRGIFTALWTTDPLVDRREILAAAPHYDHVFCQGTESMEVLQKAGAENARGFPWGATLRGTTPFRFPRKRRSFTVTTWFSSVPGTPNGRPFQKSSAISTSPSGARAGRCCLSARRFVSTSGALTPRPDSGGKSIRQAGSS